MHLKVENGESCMENMQHTGEDFQSSRREEIIQGIEKDLNKKTNRSRSKNLLTREALEMLVSQAQRGDHHSVEKLVEEFKPFVYQMEKKYFIPGGDRDDLFQEGFIGLVHAINTFKSEYNLSFEDYVSLCIRNSVIRAVRSATQKKQMVLTRAKSIFDKNVLSMKAHNANPEHIAVKTLTEERIVSIVNSKLSSKESEMLDMKVRGFSAEEIAERFNSEKKVVDNALYRARQKLKKHLTSKVKQFRIHKNRDFRFTMPVAC